MPGNRGRALALVSHLMLAGLWIVITIMIVLCQPTCSTGYSYEIPFLQSQDLETSLEQLQTQHTPLTSHAWSNPKHNISRTRMHRIRKSNWYRRRAVVSIQ